MRFLAVLLILNLCGAAEVPVAVAPQAPVEVSNAICPVCGGVVATPTTVRFREGTFRVCSMKCSSAAYQKRDGLIAAAQANEVVKDTPSVDFDKLPADVQEKVKDSYRKALSDYQVARRALDSAVSRKATLENALGLVDKKQEAELEAQRKARRAEYERAAAASGGAPAPGQKSDNIRTQATGEQERAAEANLRAQEAARADRDRAANKRLADREQETRKDLREVETQIRELTRDLAAKKAVVDGIEKTYGKLFKTDDEKPKKKTMKAIVNGKEVEIEM